MSVTVTDTETLSASEMLEIKSSIWKRQKQFKTDKFNADVPDKTNEIQMYFQSSAYDGSKQPL